MRILKGLTIAIICMLLMGCNVIESIIDIFAEDNNWEALKNDWVLREGDIKVPSYLLTETSIEEIEEILSTIEFSYIKDPKDHDYWQTSRETYNRKAGDCDDYAVAEYVLLVENGIPEEWLSLLIMKNSIKGTHHVALAIEFNGETYISSSMVGDLMLLDVYIKLMSYELEFGCNREGSWWY